MPNQTKPVIQPFNQAQPSQQPPMNTNLQHINHTPLSLPAELGNTFVRSTPQQQIIVVLGIANALIAKNMGGNKRVTIYTILKSIRSMYNESPTDKRIIETSAVMDCIDSLIYKGIVLKSDNNQAVTRDGEQFYSVLYGLSKATWTDVVAKYGFQVPEWRIAGMEFDPNNVRQSQSPLEQRNTNRNNGFRSNLNQSRINNEVSI